MKKVSIVATLLIVAGFILIQGSRLPQEQKANGFYTAEARTVIDNKCYGCHSVKGKSQDAKDALMWDSLPGLPKSKIVGTLDDIIEVLEKGAMPPEEVVKKMPEMKLQPSESEILLMWAEKKVDSMLK